MAIFSEESERGVESQRSRNTEKTETKRESRADSLGLQNEQYFEESERG